MPRRVFAVRNQHHDPAFPDNGPRLRKPLAGEIDGIVKSGRFASLDAAYAAVDRLDVVRKGNHFIHAV